MTEKIDWQHETAGFFTRPDDSHACVNVAGTEPSHAIPFCTASCNSESVFLVIWSIAKAS